MASTAATILDGGPPTASTAAAPTSTACAHCAAPGRDRCGSCRAVVYCGRACQKAAWPAHKDVCQHLLDRMHGGKPLASTRDFVLEYWRRYLPASFDVAALLPTASGALDEAAAFERCRVAAMDGILSGYSAAVSDGNRRRLVRTVIELAGFTRNGTPSLADLAVNCTARLSPVALEAVLDAGAQPGDVSLSEANGETILQDALATIARFPYVWTAHALPHALKLLRLVLARSQPRDWLTGTRGCFPLETVAGITDPTVSGAVLDCIRASPGGFPGHAVAASTCALHAALRLSTAACVKALLGAGADPNDGSVNWGETPLHALAAGGGYEFDAKLSLLMTAGARLEAVNSSGWTPLVITACEGRAAAFDALLEAGAQATALRVSLRDGSAINQSILHHLVGANNAAMIERVLATGVLAVDVRAGPALDKRTPLQWAAVCDTPRAACALLAAGASLAATDSDGDDALGVAIRFSSPKTARLLVEATPPAGRVRYKRAAVQRLVDRHRAAAAAPSDAAAAATLVDAMAVAALFAA